MGTAATVINFAQLGLQIFTAIWNEIHKVQPAQTLAQHQQNVALAAAATQSVLGSISAAPAPAAAK